MILTVTLNAALDVTYRVDQLRPHETHRVRAVGSRPGGKGVNVAAVLRALNESAIATGLVGGPTGRQIRIGLAAAGIPDAFVRIGAESRRTLVVADDRDATGFWEPGPTVRPEEWVEFLRRYRGLAKAARVVVLAGSLPAGVPADAYGQLVEIAREFDTLSIVDAEGPALLAALRAGPDVIKPNAHELSLLNTGLPDRPAGRGPGRDGVGNRGAGGGPGGPGGTPGGHPVAAARRCGARAVVASLGADGIVATTPDGDWRVPVPERLTGNPTGAGDAVVAALAHGLAYRLGWPETLVNAVALAGAAVLAPVAGAVDLPSYFRLRRAARAEPWRAPPSREGI